MATPDRPSSIQPNTSTLKSAARKLPIKRKSPPHFLSPINPTPNPNPNPIPLHPHPSPAIPDDDYEDDEFDDESQDHDHQHEHEDETNGSRSSGDHAKPPPFKFHRIWSESDEIRFLQGLLGCWSQGLIFPRDLNLFYDRFSESLPQPYSRYQLSEKLRRLRKKFRVMSGRIAGGLDPVRLPPHDRDLLHLCTRLWDPLHAPSSPFSPPDPASSGGAPGNKRRRRNPRAPPANERNGEEMAVVAVPAAALPAAIGVVDDGKSEEDMGYVTAKAVMDAFDGSLKEMRDGLLDDGSSGEMSRRWQEQRAAELDVFARRLRLVLEQSLRNRFS